MVYTAASNKPLESGRLQVGLRLQPRQKGLLWYNTFSVSFNGRWNFRNSSTEDEDVTIVFPLPSEQAIYDDLVFTIDGVPATTANEKGSVRLGAHIPAGAVATLTVGYRSQGLDLWSYSFGPEVAQVQDFQLRVVTDFGGIDFPEGSLSPSLKGRVEKGEELTWIYRNLMTAQRIQIAMPARLQPGPLAGEISYFAPVSLLFFFFVLFMVTTLRQIDLHPMNYFFLACSFFAFHLLFAYTVDILPLAAAFLIASMVSIGLTISYLRLVTGLRFAAVEAGSAQFVYLILFSAAFFIRGLTGLAITIGAILTLFLTMQMTGRVRWSELSPAGENPLKQNRNPPPTVASEVS